MRTLRILTLLLFAAIGARAADVKISDLTHKTTATTNTFLETADMSDTPKSGKMLFYDALSVFLVDSGQLDFETSAGLRTANLKTSSTANVAKVWIDLELVATNITASRALISNGNKQITNSTVTSTELALLSGATALETKAHAAGSNYVDVANAQTITGAKTFSQGATAGGLIKLAEDTDNGSSVVNLKSADALASDKTVTFSDATGTVVLEDNTATLTGKTYDAGGTGNVLKFTDYKDFIYPGRVDGSGATIVTNDYTSSVWGLASYAGSGDTNVNYAIYRIGTVPLDLDTSVAMTLKNLAVRVSGTDTDAANFSIALFSPASSSGQMPTDYNAMSTHITFNTGTLTSPAANDIFYFADVTLTGWAAAVTAGRPWIIGIARAGTDSNDDVVTVVGGTIEYGRTK